MMGEDSPETERARELIKEIAAKLYVKLPDIMVWSPSPSHKPQEIALPRTTKKMHTMICIA
jgi:hypothetical protein